MARSACVRARSTCCSSTRSCCASSLPLRGLAVRRICASARVHVLLRPAGMRLGRGRLLHVIANHLSGRNLQSTLDFRFTNGTTACRNYVKWGTTDACTEAVAPVRHMYIGSGHTRVRALSRWYGTQSEGHLLMKDCARPIAFSGRVLEE